MSNKFLSSAATRGAFPLSDTETTALISRTVELRDRIVLELMVYCGLRRHEVALLEIARVDLHAGEIVIPNSKSKRPRRVVMPPFLLDHITDYIGRRRHGFVFESRLTKVPHLSNRGVSIIVAKAGRRIGYVQKTPGLVGLSPHQLRHTFARRMKDAGFQMDDLALLMGHSNPAMTQALYGRHSFDQVKEKYLEAVKGD